MKYVIAFAAAFLLGGCACCQPKPKFIVAYEQDVVVGHKVAVERKVIVPADTVMPKPRKTQIVVRPPVWANWWMEKK